jgi:hypothetical protein
MTKFLGDKASFKFGSTVYQCLTNYSWSGSVQEAVSRCSSSTGAVTHRNAGAPDDTFTFDVILDAGDTDTINELKRGEEGAFEFHPEGDAATNIEFIATNAIVTSSNLGGGVDSHGILSITVGIDGTLTVQAASA